MNCGVLGQLSGTVTGAVGAGVVGVGDEGTYEGVLGIGRNGVHGQSSSPTNSGVWGENTGAGVGVAGSSVSGNGIQGSSQSGNAGEFQGNVLVTGNAVVQGNHTVQGTLTAIIDIVLGGDCAEEFDVAAAQQLEPGTVVVIDQEGALRESGDAYDKKVAGVVSGAGGYRPGIVLDRKAADVSRAVVALIGKVYCKVDAEYAPIEVGDLLTPSPTPGHAMKASDPSRAFGAVIGKALRPLQGGRGLVPVLVALQ